MVKAPDYLFDSMSLREAGVALDVGGVGRGVISRRIVGTVMHKNTTSYYIISYHI